MSRLLNVRPVFRDAATNAAFRNVKAIRTMPSAGARNEGLHLHRHGGNLRDRPGDRDGPHQGRRGVPAESTPDDPRRDAAIEGCLKAGATEVLIADSHWNLDNLIPEELHEAATLLRGTPRGVAIRQRPRWI